MIDLPEAVYELTLYLPIDDLEVNEYTNFIKKSILNNYEKEEYQFGYFGFHILFMTYIYCTVWKISQFYKDRYEDTMIFARPYRDNENKIDFTNVKSVFDFSYIPEKDIFKFFVLIGVDSSYISNIVKLIDTRNNMAHATGKIQIYKEEELNAAMKEIMSVVKNINEKMKNSIRNYYENKLIDYVEGVYKEEYSTFSDLIKEELIKFFSFSQSELAICSEFGVSRFNDKERYNFSHEKIEAIKHAHQETKAIYKDMLEFG